MRQQYQQRIRRSARCMMPLPGSDSATTSQPTRQQGQRTAGVQLVIVRLTFKSHPDAAADHPNVNFFSITPDSMLPPGKVWDCYLNSVFMNNSLLDLQHW